MPNTPASGESDWIVRIERRRDGKRYFFRYDGCTTARHESSLRMGKDVAQQLAHAIATQHPDFTARACRYDSPVHRKKQKSAKTEKERDSAADQQG